MQILKIESIKHGWFEMRIGKHYIDCSDYLGTDTPKDLLEAVYNLLQKKTEEEWLCWDDEPGAFIMSLELIENKILVTLYGALLPSYNIQRSAKTLEENCGEQEWSEIVDLTQFLDELVTEFSLYKDGTGRCIYEKNWMLFPETEFSALRAFALGLSI